MATTTSEADEITHFRDADGNMQPIPSSATRGPPVTPLEYRFLQQHCFADKLPIDFSSATSIEGVCNILVQEAEATRRFVLGIHQNHWKIMQDIKGARERLETEIKSIQESYDNLSILVQYHREDITEVNSRMKAVQRMIGRRLRDGGPAPPSVAMEHGRLVQTLNPTTPERLTKFPPSVAGSLDGKRALLRLIGPNHDRFIEQKARAVDAMITLTPTAYHPWSLSPSARLEPVTHSASSSVSECDPASASASSSSPPSSPAADSSGPIPPHLKVHIERVAREIQRARNSTSRMLLDKVRMEQQQSDMHIAAQDEAIKTVWEKHETATAKTYDAGWNLKHKLEPAVGQIERIMDDLAPEEEPPAEGANVDRVPVPEGGEQNPVYSVTLEIESDKTIDELTEEEAKELLRFLPLQVTFDPTRAHAEANVDHTEEGPRLDATAVAEDDPPAASEDGPLADTEDHPQVVDGEDNSGQVSPCTKTRRTPVERWRRKHGSCDSKVMGGESDSGQAPPARATAVHTPVKRWRRKRGLLDSKAPSTSASTSTSRKRRRDRDEGEGMAPRNDGPLKDGSSHLHVLSLKRQKMKC